MTEDIKRAAVKLYESCVFDQLLGETLRPGGLGLTARIAEVAGLGSGNIALDIACGKGTTAFFLAREYDCRVIGIDLSDKMISLCRSRTDAEVSGRVSFLLGDGENLPFRDSSFDTVISECSFSLLPDKESAAKDIYRVLKLGGKLVMTDIILKGEVSEELRRQTSFACCLAGACRAEEYIKLLERVGFQSAYWEDHSSELRKIAFPLAAAFGSINNFVGKLPVEPCRRKEVETVASSGDTTPSAEAFSQFLRLGRPGYGLMAATKM